MNSRHGLAIQDAQQARLYLEAAAELLGPSPHGNPMTSDIADFRFLNPVSHLVAHAVELSLSAYLRVNNEAGGLSSHDLVGRLTAAKRIGLAVSPRFEQYVRAIAPAHESGQFRYARPTPQGFVTPRVALEFVRAEVELIEGHVITTAYGMPTG